ncbi:MAG: class I SAM-dependent methyltransferase [Deltaproteobacteria bacterium]|nr:class I SAM-dependent methyltransferase [Deltaproteobacteria bacterium]
MRSHEQHGHGPGRDPFGNPKDLKAYLKKLLSPERDAWQRPERVARELRIRGKTVAEIGPGPGYFTLPLARAVGRGGRVFAVEVEPRLMSVLRDRLIEHGVGHVTPVLGLPEDPLLPAASCDLVFAVNTFHHFHRLPAYLRKLARALKPGGRIVNIDFHKRELPFGPPVDHKLSREDFLASARRAGLRLATESDLLPYQYFLTLKLSRS